MFNQDYILREIEGLTRFLAKTVFHKDLAWDSLIIDEDGLVSGDGFFRHTLLKMLAEKRPNDAENLLFEEIEKDPKPEYLAIAVDFYRRLGEMGDRELAEAGFSREEIGEGLSEIRRMYGVP